MMAISLAVAAPAPREPALLKCSAAAIVEPLRVTEHVVAHKAYIVLL
jgi:hypothetical protein